AILLAQASSHTQRPQPLTKVADLTPQRTAIALQQLPSPAADFDSLAQFVNHSTFNFLPAAILQAELHTIHLNDKGARRRRLRPTDFDPSSAGRLLLV